MTSGTKLAIATALMIIGLDPLPPRRPVVDACQALSAASYVYHHANATVDTKLSTIFRALPAIQAASPETKAAFKALAGPYFHSIGLVDSCPLLHAARDSFDYACGGPTKAKQALDEYAWIAYCGAKARSGWQCAQDAAKIRDALRKATGQ